MADASPPLIEIVGLVKASPGLPTIRLRHLIVRPGDRYTIQGLDAGAAEALVHLITGAALPDHGDVRVGGQRTEDVATDMAWLASLDRFGIVTERAVLLDGFSIAGNLALPITVEVDPMADDVRRRVDALARAVGLDVAGLDRQAANLAPLERMRVHLARALATDPQTLLLEQPTATLDAAASRAFGESLRRVADERHLAWIAFATDEVFADAAGGRRGKVNLETGEWTEAATTFWRRVLTIPFR